MYRFISYNEHSYLVVKCFTTFGVDFHIKIDQNMYVDDLMCFILTSEGGSKRDYELYCDDNIILLINTLVIINEEKGLVVFKPDYTITLHQ